MKNNVIDVKQNRFCFFDIRNNQDRGKCYKPSRRSRLTTLSETLIFPDITKNESNNCFVIHCFEAKNEKRLKVSHLLADN